MQGKEIHGSPGAAKTKNTSRTRPIARASKYNYIPSMPTSVNYPEACVSRRNYRLYHADSTSFLAEFPKKSIDVIFADPPYNLSNNGTTCHAGKRVSVNKGAWDASRGIEADFQFHLAWLAVCRDVLKPEGTIWISGTYHSIYSCGFALQQQGWDILNDIVWYKPNAAPNLACRMFTASHETLLWARKTKSTKHYFDYKAMKSTKSENDIFKKDDRQMRSVWCLPTPGNSEKSFGKHPTQKPVSLLERIITASCPPNGTILDPFCGSGTTGVAALKHGRKFIGIDSNREYLDKLAEPRLREVSNTGAATPQV